MKKLIIFTGLTIVFSAFFSSSQSMKDLSVNYEIRKADDSISYYLNNTRLNYDIIETHLNKQFKKK